MNLRMGIIGGGSIARVHLEAYAAMDNVRLLGLADPNEQILSDVYRSGKIERVTSDYRELINEPNIDVVDICVPHHLHHKITLDALKAGKHVILEKPIALTIEEADEMIEVAEKLNRRLFVSLNQRFLPAHITAKQLLDAKKIGKPFLAVAVCIGDEFERMNDPNSWKGTWEQGGGGVLADTGTHFVDILQYFFGPAKAVNATTKRLVVSAKNKADDTSTVTLEFGNGVLGELVLTYSATANQWAESKDIYGTAGSLHISGDPASPLKVVYNRGLPRHVEVGSSSSWQNFSIRKALEHFVDCILYGRSSLVTACDARETLKTVLSAYQAAREGRRIQL
ncbi:MAG: Gfo/Idh/MocA family oxidoreductase [Firmicutes bacterium]|nr:Gfo/Idh/MocA family oxidoreductase [Bacillota bacterium]